jgi:hypothetical protein
MRRKGKKAALIGNRLGNLGQVGPDSNSPLQSRKFPIIFVYPIQGDPQKEGPDLDVPEKTGGLY